MNKNIVVQQFSRKMMSNQNQTKGQDASCENNSGKKSQ